MAETLIRAFDVHGMGIEVRSDWPEVDEAVASEFGWYERPSRDVRLRVEILQRSPDLGRFGPRRASFVTPRNVVYASRDVSIVDYFGRAVTVLDRAAGVASVEGDDPELVREATRHLLLASIGEHLDSIGLPRLHALAVSRNGRALALLLPAGGGKTQLALQALADDDVRLVADDMPLLDASGQIRAFPVVGISVNPTDAHKLPGGEVRVTERMEFHARSVLTIPSIAGRIDPGPTPLRHLVIGRRTLADAPAVEPASRRAAARALIRQCVVGVDLYQGMEFLFRHGLVDAAGRVGTVAMRAHRCALVLRGAAAWTIELGRDDEANWAALRGILDR